MLGLRHADGQLRHFAVTRPIGDEAHGPLPALLAEAGPSEAAIKSRWQHDAEPPWLRVEPRVVREVRVTKSRARPLGEIPCRLCPVAAGPIRSRTVVMSCIRSPQKTEGLAKPLPVR